MAIDWITWLIELLGSDHLGRAMAIGYGDIIFTTVKLTLPKKKTVKLKWSKTRKLSGTVQNSAALLGRKN